MRLTRKLPASFQMAWAMSPDELARLYSGIVNAFRHLALVDDPVITFDDVPDLYKQQTAADPEEASCWRRFRSI